MVVDEATKQVKSGCDRVLHSRALVRVGDLVPLLGRGLRWRPSSFWARFLLLLIDLLGLVHSSRCIYRTFTYIHIRHFHDKL